MLTWARSFYICCCNTTRSFFIRCCNTTTSFYICYCNITRSFHVHQSWMPSFCHPPDRKHNSRNMAIWRGLKKALSLLARLQLHLHLDQMQQLTSSNWDLFPRIPNSYMHHNLPGMPGIDRVQDNCFWWQIVLAFHGSTQLLGFKEHKYNS